MSQTTGASPLLTAGEAAEFLRASKAKVYRLVKQGDLAGYRVGATLVFYQSELHDFVRRQAARPAQDEAQARGRRLGG